MKGLEAVVVVVLAVVATILLFRWKSGMARKALEGYLAAQGATAEIVKIGIPPARLWIHNRKGDSWALLRTPDGAETWARVRGPKRIDLFD